MKSVEWFRRLVTCTFHDGCLLRPPSCRICHVTKIKNTTYLQYLSQTFHLKTTEAYKGHCVLCKDVLSFVSQTFDF